MHGGNVELLAPQYGFEVQDVLDFSANINPYGPPPGTRELLAQSWPDIARYPDPHSTQLRAALARWHDVAPENITVANGASELIYWIARLFSTPQALILGPAFTEYADAVQSAHGKVRYQFAKDWTFGVGAFWEDYVLKDTQTGQVLYYMPGSFFLNANNGDYQSWVGWLNMTYSF